MPTRPTDEIQEQLSGLSERMQALEAELSTATEVDALVDGLAELGAIDKAAKEIRKSIAPRRNALIRSIFARFSDDKAPTGRMAEAFGVTRQQIYQWRDGRSH